jgi:LPS sulfotransferase NodH
VPQPPPGTNFVILFEGRTGSTWLIEALAGHPQVSRAVAEPLTRLAAAGAEAQSAWIERFFPAPPTMAAGFKTKLRNVCDPQGFRALLEREDVRVIHQTRRDLLAAVISEVNGARLRRTTGTWNVYAEQQRTGVLHADVDDVAERMRWRIGFERALDEFVQSLTVPVLRLDYAELLHDPADYAARVQRFLGIPVRAISGSVVKNTSVDLSAAVDNYDDLVDGLRRRGLA